MKWIEAAMMEAVSRDLNITCQAFLGCITHLCLSGYQSLASSHLISDTVKI
jgi:hypothetical protein